VLPKQVLYHISSPSALVILEFGLASYLPRLAVNQYPSDLSFPSSYIIGMSYWCPALYLLIKSDFQSYFRR
jgi:hypothetical protein